MRRQKLIFWTATLMILALCGRSPGQVGDTTFHAPTLRSGPLIGQGDPQTNADESEPLLQRLGDIESRLRDLERLPAVGPPANVIFGPEATEAGTAGLVSVANFAPDQEVEYFPSRFFVDYDKGFVLRPYDKQQTPFELKVRARMQFRHVGFSRNVSTWTDNAGVTRPVDTRNDFELERARLDFQGFFFDPKLRFFVQIDGDTDDNHRAVFHDFWVNYEFSDALNLYVGKAFVPGSRDWLNGSHRTHLADRSMATTFFRPDRTIGVWAIGEPVENLHYRAMVGNGFNTTDLAPGDVDDELAYSASVWWDPLGDFGSGYADLEHHDSPVIRLGNSFTYASQGPRDDGTPRAEQKFERLSDGTLLTDPGALAPGVTVDAFDIYLYTVDLAAKYRGWSANGEYFFRWVNDFRTIGGPIPHDELYTDGFYADVGCMLIARKLEIVARLSTVDGLFGDAWEYAAGINWFINGEHSNKLTFDVSVLNRNPASNSGPNYVPGQDGILYRMQWQVATY